MQKGWKATGLLQPLWGRVGGRDELARIVGMQRATISGYNTGRLNMTLNAARRLALALDVTIYDLGAPADAERETSPILAELAEINERFGTDLADIKALLAGAQTSLVEVARMQGLAMQDQAALLKELAAAVADLRAMLEGPGQSGHGQQ